MKTASSLRHAFAASATLMIGLVGLLAPASCKKINEAKDCHGLCERYKECVDSLVDTDACEDRCTDRADDNETLRNQIDDCTDCDDNKSCGELTSTCTSCAAAYTAIR